MKQTLLLFGLIVFFSVPLCLTSQAQIPRISSICYTDSCYVYHGKVITDCQQTNFSHCKVETSRGDGSRDTLNVYSFNYFASCDASPTWHWAWGTESSHSYAVPGTYTVKTVLIYGGARVDSVSTSENVSCAYVGGHLYQDLNSDCVYNPGTDPHVSSGVQIQVDSNGVHVDTVTAYGYWHYRVSATTTTNYDFKLIGPMPRGYVVACPSSGLVSFVCNPGFPTIPTLDFGFNCSTPAVFDLQLLWSRAFHGTTSGGNSSVFLTARNNTCLPTTGTVILQVSPKYNITTSGITPTPVSVSGNTITWTIPSMVNGPGYGLYVPLTPLSTTNNGDTVCTYAIITPMTGDVNVANNSISVCDSVRSSWDPNHKAVSPDGDIAAGSLLTYTVQFENLGNDTAFNVHVQDTLSANVDASSLAVISSTHPMSTNLYQEPGGRTVVKFDFPDIRLADNTHPLTNKGSLTFSVKAKTGLSAGTKITNQAGIYFDGNPVVMTNTAFNKIPVPSSVQLVNHTSGITVYPNPAHEAFMIRVQQGNWTEANLMNAIGQIVSKMPLTPGENVLNVQLLPAGIYYLQAKGTSGTSTQRVEKH